VARDQRFRFLGQTKRFRCHRSNYHRPRERMVEMAAKAAANRTMVEGSGTAE
jgi:hypothetical protein